MINNLRHSQEMHLLTIGTKQSINLKDQLMQIIPSDMAIEDYYGQPGEVSIYPTIWIGSYPGFSFL
jgi:hypothetical protein